MAQFIGEPLFQGSRRRVDGAGQGGRVPVDDATFRGVEHRCR